MSVTARTASEWRTFAGGLRPNTKLIIGDSSIGADNAPFELISPRDGRVAAVVENGGAVEIDLAVAAARRAFDEGPWPRMLPRERKAIMLRWVSLIEAHRDELAALITLEMGKPIADTWGIEMRAVLQTYQWYAELADKTLEESSPVGMDALALITREPVGVVGVVTPWNFPLTLSAWKIAPALATGCTVVHKPSEQTPLSAVLIAELALEAGLPPGVLNVVPSLGRVAGERLGRHPDVDALAFTGSTPVGRAYAEYGAQSNLKRVWLELGGKSANIVLPDAPDLEAVAQTAAWGVYFNSGQMCTAPSRLVLHEAIADDVLARVASILGQVTPADPLDPTTRMGPLSSAARRIAVEKHVADAVSDGGVPVLLGDRGQSQELSGEGVYLSPSVFDEVDPRSRLAREEVFGPVLAVTRVRDEDEAVAVANDSVFGLAAGLWTADVSRVHRLSRRLRAGTVWVNCYEEGDLTVPFGGFKQSGNGRDKSVHALEKYTELKTTYIQL